MIIMITMDIMRTVKKIIMFIPVLKMKSLQSTHFIHMELFAMWINLEVSVKYYTQNIHATCILTHVLGSCPEFGVSGSGVVREWKRRPENGPAIDTYFENYDEYYENYAEDCFNDYYYFGSGSGDSCGSGYIPYDYEKDPQYQHSFVGPLSMSKGCDLTFDYTQFRKNTKVPEFIYRGK